MDELNNGGTNLILLIALVVIMGIVLTRKKK